MNVDKLIITPIVPKASKVVINDLTASRASDLIKDKLEISRPRIGDTNKKALKHFKLPKFLRGFVNPETRVIK
ncbi:MAG: hypothetical protein E7Z89_00070 [Cyanobacteria bacterium SIG28]|nr:hypothetical protein [Cyanobacteria bacterium SIG28]